MLRRKENKTSALWQDSKRWTNRELTSRTEVRVKVQKWSRNLLPFGPVENLSLNLSLQVQPLTLLMSMLSLRLELLE